MKKAIIIFTLCVSVYACGNQDSAKKEESNTTTGAVSETPGGDTTKAAGDDKSAAKLSSNPDYKKGLELIAGADCLTCHKVDEKNIGPAYRDVANKYENTKENVSMLADKIIKGGQGVWGTVPMTPHASLSKADAEQMVKYVMLLKK